MTFKQTTWLCESLPKCAGIFRSAGERNAPDWVIVHFQVPPDEVDVADMQNVSEIFANRTQALIASWKRARALYPKGPEDGHRAVWRNEQGERIYWQSVMPLSALLGQMATLKLNESVLIDLPNIAKPLDYNITKPLVYNMEIFDCDKYFNRCNTDVFQAISPEDLQSLHMESKERQGVFKPVATNMHLPVRAAMLALNAYAGDDYRTFFAEPNPMVKACRTHLPLIIKLPAVIANYRLGIPSLANGAFYFTNFVKVYPPESEFKNAQQMGKIAKEQSTSDKALLPVSQGRDH